MINDISADCKMRARRAVLKWWFDKGADIHDMIRISVEKAERASTPTAFIRLHAMAAWIGENL